MVPHRINGFATTSGDAREHLADLEEERKLAVTSGLAEIESYIRDLDAEIEVWRRLYVTTVVTEIATLHAELTGPRLG
jgi:hypothetical protein